MSIEEMEFSDELQQQKKRIESPLHGFGFLFIDGEDSHIIDARALEEFNHCKKDILYWFLKYYKNGQL